MSQRKFYLETIGLCFGIALLAMAIPGAAYSAGAAKVSVCHIPPGNPDNWHTITISENALEAHLAHGDLGGACDQFCTTLCDDGDACTIAECDPNGGCLPKDPVNCDDGSLCTADSCNSASGCVNAPKDCDSGDLCLIGSCALDTGECVNSPVVCDSGQECNSDTGECENSGPVVTPGYSSLTGAAGVRYRGNSSGNEIYLGIPDLAVGSNRVENSYPDVYSNWQDGTYVVTFSFDQAANKVTTTINGSGGFDSLEYDFDDLLPPGCPTANWNTMDINVVDRLTTGELAFNNVMLDSFSLGNFDGEGWNNWTVSNFDFSQSFTVTGDLVVQGWTGSETNKLQIVVGCLP